MTSDSSGGFFKTIEVRIGSFCTALIALAGIIRTIIFKASIEEIISYVVAAIVILVFVVIISILRKTGEKKDAQRDETLAFSLPIYSRADRLSITPEFREKLNKNRKKKISEIKPRRTWRGSR